MNSYLYNFYLSINYKKIFQFLKGTTFPFEPSFFILFFCKIKQNNVLF